jgi:hypothetical protein
LHDCRWWKSDYVDHEDTKAEETGEDIWKEGLREDSHGEYGHGEEGLGEKGHGEEVLRAECHGEGHSLCNNSW